MAVYEAFDFFDILSDKEVIFFFKKGDHFFDDLNVSSFEFNNGFNAVYYIIDIDPVFKHLRYSEIIFQQNIDRYGYQLIKEAFQIVVIEIIVLND